MIQLSGIFCEQKEKLSGYEIGGTWNRGLISGMYLPADDKNIQKGERVFYTTWNAAYIDTARMLIENFPADVQAFFIAPLIAEASIHANTGGVFKGFYKNSETGLGQFGGRKGDALSYITADIDIDFPVFSNFDCETQILQGNFKDLIDSVFEVDIAYVDPPYNQHPYGSNYFMLNIIADNKVPIRSSRVSGIPADWNRSAYNRTADFKKALQYLVGRIKAKYVLVSFNSEDFISANDMKTMLMSFGKISIFNCSYNTYRGSRNLQNRSKYVTEFLYLIEKNNSASIQTIHGNQFSLSYPCFLCSILFLDIKYEEVLKKYLILPKMARKLFADNVICTDILQN